MNERLDTIIKSPYFVPAITGVAAFVVGAGVGFVLGRRNRFEILVPAAYEVPERIIFSDESINKPKPERVVIPVEALDDDEYEEEEEETVEQLIEPHDLIRSNIFAQSTGEWDYEVELAQRSKSRPYIIHHDEFFEENDLDYAQMSLTYYAGDDKLTDEAEVPIYNTNEIVGDCLRFGHGSGDENVVYIRNDKFRAEYEVTRDPGHYSIEVLGLEMEQEVEDLKHSNSIPKFQME